MPGQGGGVAPAPSDNEPVVKAPLAQAPQNELGAGAPPPSPMAQHFGDAASAAAAQYAQVKEAVVHVAAVRKELDGLVALHDTITSDDVVKAASAITGSGAMSAAEVATLLAEMPEGGEALASWVSDKDQSVSQMETQLEQAISISRHRMGVTALKQLMAHGAENQSAAPSMATNPNPLTIH